MAETEGRLTPPPNGSPYERIKTAILEGVFQPAAPLIESALAEWCGVSRTPVREALTRLEQDGLVERGERGLIVRDRSPEEILGIYEVRIILESTSARFAAERHTSFDAIRLERLLRACEETDALDPLEMSRRNRALHQGIAKATHNDSLVDVLNRLNLHLTRYPATTLSHPGRWEESHVQHRKLVEAILRRDQDEAAEMAEQHFESAQAIRLQLWDLDAAT